MSARIADEHPDLDGAPIRRRMLALLLDRPGRVVEYATLEALCREPSPDAVKTHAFRLRRYLRRAGLPYQLRCVRGLGYRLLRTDGG